MMMKKYLKLYVAVLVVSLVSIFEIQLSKTAVYEEESLDSGIKVVAQENDVWESYANGSVDTELGAPFRRYGMHTKPAYGMDFRSTLVEYPYGSFKRADSLVAPPARGIILYVHGYCSEDGEEWSENYMHCDGVLDVEHIEKWAPKVGVNVKTETVAGGLHDLYLSRKEVRDDAYAKTFRFIDETLQAESGDGE